MTSTDHAAQQQRADLAAFRSNVERAEREQLNFISMPASIGRAVLDALAGQPAAPVAANDTLRAAILALQSAYQDEPGDDYANGFAAGHRNARWAAAELVSAAASEAAPVAATEQATARDIWTLLCENGEYARSGNYTVIYEHHIKGIHDRIKHLFAPLATPADAGAGLTDERIDELWSESGWKLGDGKPTMRFVFARAIEREVLARQSTPAAPVTASEREAFEGWMRSDGCGGYLGRYNVYDPNDERGYKSRHTTNKWEGWAARAKIGGQSPAPVTAEPVAHLYEWIGDDESVRRKGDIIARSVEELNGNIDMHQHCWKRIGALSAAPVSPQPAAQVPSIQPWHERTDECTPTATVMAMESEIADLRAALKGQPAAQVPSIDRDSVLAEARAAVRELQDNLETFGPYGEESARVALDGALDAIDELKGQPAAAHAAKTEWISVDERLPGDDCRVLAATWFTMTHDQHMDIVSFRRGSGQFSHSDVTHWMPLPDAPIAAAHAAHDQKGGE